MSVQFNSVQFNYVTLSVHKPLKQIKEHKQTFFHGGLGNEHLPEVLE